MVRGLPLLAAIAIAPPAFAQKASPAAPLVIGETFTIESKTLSETRRINVYAPAIYSDSPNVRLPVLYMPDGGVAEDFIHIAGLVQVSTGNGTMRPFLLVGIENTQRRRDMTGPTQNPEDKKIAPVVGGSAAFRNFIRSELMPVIKSRYRTTDETAIMGESLAGLFIVETLFVEPDLFDTYIAFDPSIWWNSGGLLRSTPSKGSRAHTVFLASSSDDVQNEIEQLAELVRAKVNSKVYFQPMTAETHATIYHPAALLALRKLFSP